MADQEVLILREQFRTPPQRRETATLGMWIFLATEVMLFGGLFVAFTVYRTSYPDAFIRGSADMNIALGAINTAVLIGSSFTMALAVYAAEVGRRKVLNLFLASTMLFGIPLRASALRRPILFAGARFRVEACGPRRFLAQPKADDRQRQ